MRVNVIDNSDMPQKVLCETLSYHKHEEYCAARQDAESTLLVSAATTFSGN